MFIVKIISERNLLESSKEISRDETVPALVREQFITRATLNSFAIEISVIVPRVPKSL